MKCFNFSKVRIIWVLRQKVWINIIGKIAWEKPLSYLLLDQKVTKNQGFRKIWLKVESISLNKNRPRRVHLFDFSIVRRLIFVFNAPLPQLSGTNFSKAGPL